MAEDKSLDLLQRARLHRRKAAEARTRALMQSDPDIKTMYEDLARFHEAAAEDSEGYLSPGQTTKS